MIGSNKEVFFDVYCPMCKFKDDDESDVNSPCYDCLEAPVNQDSHKPINYKSEVDEK